MTPTTEELVEWLDRIENGWSLICSSVVKADGQQACQEIKRRLTEHKPDFQDPKDPEHWVRCGRCKQPIGKLGT